jgi:hypothetical protein
MEQAAKPVLIYFSRQPVVSSSIDPDKYARLTAFRDSLKERVLFGEYSTPDELRRKVSADITQFVRDRFGAASARDPARAGSPGASLLASFHREREVSGFDQRGNPRYRTDWRLQSDRLEAPDRESRECLGRGTCPLDSKQLVMDLLLRSMTLTRTCSVISIRETEHSFKLTKWWRRNRETERSQRAYRNEG